jgi:hypothetical protein
MFLENLWKAEIINALSPGLKDIPLTLYVIIELFNKTTK